MITDLDHKKIAQDLFSDIQKVDLKNVPNLRRIRKKYSKKLSEASAEQILTFVRYFIAKFNYRWIPFEILYCHSSAITLIGVKELEEFGKELNSWGAVDLFAGYLAGPAWRNGQVSDELILGWTNSKDHWWRRAALVCTVPLNKHSAGGQGDVERTLKICRRLAADKNDMVIKALSWALRELIPHDREAVIKFTGENENVLAAKVKREVNNKLTTGLKNPKRA
jgi:3-methyladenine DNA glycosylase AlkD